MPRHELEEAEGAKEQAEGLVSAAVANRAEVEAELLATLERYQSLSFQLSSVSADLARLSDLIDSDQGRVGRRPPIG